MPRRPAFHWGEYPMVSVANTIQPIAADGRSCARTINHYMIRLIIISYPTHQNLRVAYVDVSLNNLSNWGFASENLAKAT